MLSVIIPARNEIYLQRTIQNVLDNADGDIEVIAVLDGYWPDPPINDDKRVILIHHTESIGQRQSINEAARIAKGEYIMKLDAHCAVDKGFDVKLAADCANDWTVIPRMYNLDHETWKPKLHKRTDYMYIGLRPNGELRAEYYDKGLHQPDNDKPIDDILCAMGPCFFMRLDRLWALGGMDEGHSGWGQMGIELACKSWLSGGAMKVSKRTWFSHWFRGGGGPGFPYPLSGKQVQHARNYSKDLWLNNKWPGQVLPFSWLIERFKPVPSWHDSDGLALAKITEAGVAFSLSLKNRSSVGSPISFLTSSGANSANTPSPTIDMAKRMAINAGSFPRVDSGRAPITLHTVPTIGDELKMVGVATSRVKTSMVENGDIASKAIPQRGNQPSISKPMGLDRGTVILEPSIPSGSQTTSPVPASSCFISDDFGSEPNCGTMVGIDDKKLISIHKENIQQTINHVKQNNDTTIIYLTDNTLDETISRKCREKLLEVAGNHPIISVSQKPIEFGDVRICVGEIGRSWLSLIKQLLAGCEAATTKYVAIAEHDCLYTKEHFDFIPPKDDVFYYNSNHYLVEWHSNHPELTGMYSTVGRHRNAMSQMICNRKLLIECENEKLDLINKGIKGMWSLEPGVVRDHHVKRAKIATSGSCAYLHPYIDQYAKKYGRDFFKSPNPNLDIRHGTNFTGPKRGKNRTYEIPYWGKFETLWEVRA